MFRLILLQSSRPSEKFFRLFPLRLYPSSDPSFCVELLSLLLLHPALSVCSPAWLQATDVFEPQPAGAKLRSWDAGKLRWRGLSEQWGWPQDGPEMKNVTDLVEINRLKSGQNGTKKRQFEQGKSWYQCFLCVEYQTHCNSGMGKPTGGLVCLGDNVRHPKHSLLPLQAWTWEGRGAKTGLDMRLDLGNNGIGSKRAITSNCQNFWYSNLQP